MFQKNLTSVPSGCVGTELCTRRLHPRQLCRPCFSLFARYPWWTMEKSPLEVKDLYPNLTDEELALARENLDGYLEIAWEIFEDMELDEVLKTFPESPSRDTIKERSILPTN